MSDITPDDVLRLARLARIELSQDEVDSFASELTSILQYVEQLQQVDVTGLEPTSQVTGLTNVMRADEVQDYGYEPQTLLKNVPRVEDNHIQAERMIG